MRPAFEQLQEEQMDEVRQQIEHHFKECQALVSKLSKIKRKQPRLIATYKNANGMSNMYYTDHVAHEVSIRGSYLKIARDSLLKAEKYLPDDWANTCDLGSVELRLAILARDTEKSDVEVDAHFSVGRDYLLRVVNRLRPGYGFALYELGILHRVWGKWDEAYQFQQKALQVPEKYRDTKDERVKEELERISNKDNSYP
jgi:tetratricopeptide (TPR) repeat protein